MVKNDGLSVHLSVAASSSPQDRQKVVSLSVTESGEYAWNKEVVGLPQLIGRLQEFQASTPDGKYLLSGGQARFQKVVTVLDEVRKSGITKVAIQTSPMP